MHVLKQIPRPRAIVFVLAWGLFVTGYGLYGTSEEWLEAIQGAGSPDGEPIIWAAIAGIIAIGCLITLVSLLVKGYPLLHPSAIWKTSLIVIPPESVVIEQLHGVSGKAIIVEIQCSNPHQPPLRSFRVSSLPAILFPIKAELHGVESGRDVVIASENSQISIGYPKVPFREINVQERLEFVFPVREQYATYSLHVTIIPPEKDNPPSADRDIQQLLLSVTLRIGMKLGDTSWKAVDLASARAVPSSNCNPSR